MSWIEVAIGEIASLVTKGTTPTTYGMPYIERGINFVKAEALNGETSLDPLGFNFIDESTHEKLSRSQLQEYDVLITIAGANVGKCGIVRAADLPANTNQAVGIIRVNKTIADPSYVYYHFKLPSTRRQCLSIGGQAAQPNVNLTVLKGFKFSLPALNVQGKVASILSAYDDLIENNRRRIQLLEQSARLLYKEWFVHLRFPGHEHVKIVDGIPERWERRTLTELAESVSYGFTASSTQEAVGPKFLRITDIVPPVLNWDGVPFCEASAEDIHRNLLEVDDVVVARTGATVGYAKLISFLEVQAVYASYLVCFRFRTPAMSLIAGVFMESDTYKDYVRNHAGGAAQPNANAKVLGSPVLMIPPQILQEQFCDFVRKCLSQRDTLIRQNSRLSKARDLLLPRLMNGEVAV